MANVRFCHSDQGCFLTGGSQCLQYACRVQAHLILTPSSYMRCHAFFMRVPDRKTCWGLVTWLDYKNLHIDRCWLSLRASLDCGDSNAVIRRTEFYQFHIFMEMKRYVLNSIGMLGVLSAWPSLTSLLHPNTTRESGMVAARQKREEAHCFGVSSDRIGFPAWINARRICLIKLWLALRIEAHHQCGNSKRTNPSTLCVSLLHLCYVLR